MYGWVDQLKIIYSFQSFLNLDLSEVIGWGTEQKICSDIERSKNIYIELGVPCRNPGLKKQNRGKMNVEPKP